MHENNNIMLSYLDIWVQVLKILFFFFLRFICEQLMHIRMIEIVITRNYIEQYHTIIVLSHLMEGYCSINITNKPREEIAKLVGKLGDKKIAGF